MTPTEETPSTLRKALKLGAALLIPSMFFVYLFGLTLKFPLNDPDLWWHLKSGEYMMEQSALITEDPFSYTSAKPLNKHQRVGLKAQWLGQIIFATPQKLWGLAGVAMFRNVLIVMPMLLLYIWLRRRKMHYMAALGVISLPALLLALQLFYSFERPQGISFSLALVLLILLERLRRHCSSPQDKAFDISMVLLPLLMAIWSNIHAGFIVGSVIIGMYLGAELVTEAYHRIRRRPFVRTRPTFYIICLASMGAAFLNPNGASLFQSYLLGLLKKFSRDITHTITGGAGQSNWVENVVLEFKPLYYFYSELFYKWIMYYWIFIGLLYASMFYKYWVRRRIDLAELAVVSFIAFFANYYARGLMFSLTILPFYMGKTMLEIKPPAINLKAVYRGAVVAVVILAISFLTFTYPRNLKHILTPKIAPYWITPWYPQSLSNFIEKVKPQGPMYNFYTWGGFLIWRLYPQYKVFIDGRALDANINWVADSILKTFPGWERQIEAYNINFIVIPVVFRESGHIIPLATRLIRKDNWRLVYLRNNSAMFIRDVPKNRAIIGTYQIAKWRIYQEIITVENILLMGMPGNPTYLVSIADALAGLGKFDDAKKIYKQFPRRSARQLRSLKAMGR